MYFGEDAFCQIFFIPNFGGFNISGQWDNSVIKHMFLSANILNTRLLSHDD